MLEKRLLHPRFLQVPEHNPANRYISPPPNPPNRPQTCSDTHIRIYVQFGANNFYRSVGFVKPLHYYAYENENP